jgi:extracellular solute-binding protein (family 5)
VKVNSRSALGFAFACVLAIMAACAPRTKPPVVSSPQPAAQSPEPPAAPPLNPEPPLPPPVTEPRREVVSRQCTLISEPGEPIATIALTDRVDPTNAPHPSNESERLLFRQLYETLVRVDCDGHVAPGLADSWRLSVDGRTWIVTLRSDARFSNGEPVNAADVLAGWRRHDGSGELQPRVNRLVQSIISVDETTLAITLRNPRVDTPIVLAHTDLAIARRIPGSVWPVGTRRTRITADRETLAVTTADGGSTVRFLVAPGDPRDVLDKGVDLLLTRDPAVLDYAATLLQFQSVPLAWHRTYVLLAPGRTVTSPALTEEARQMLADDAVRGEARGAQGPFWWQMVPDCDLAPPQPRDRSLSGERIVYDSNDGAARDLAERFVGLFNATGPGPTRLREVLFPDRPRRSPRAAGLAGEALALARRRGTDAAYIMSLEHRPLDPCRELQAIAEGARWLEPEAVVPLVDTRLRAVVRRGRSDVDVEWDGGLLIGMNNPR